VLRARDFHRKEKTLQVLEERATFRNEDEFYFGMQGRKTKRGVEQARASEANKYSQGELQLMDTQDVKYVAMRATIDRKRAERLRSNLHSVDQAGQANRRTVFVDSEAERQEVRREPRGTAAPEAAAQPLPRAARKRRERSYRELEERQKRASRLEALAEKMEAKRVGRAKGRKRKVGTRETAAGKVPIFRFKNERKR
jgi:U3 small nucleolar RNA-associated protein 11